MIRNQTIGVAIVEDNSSIGAGLRRVIEASEQFHCAGLWTSAEEALKKIPGFMPQVVLMDINLPGMSGIEATAALRNRFPEIRIVMITVYRDHQKIFDALKAGASGYLLKRAMPDEVRAAIRDVLTGGAPMSPEIARCIVEAFHVPVAEETSNVNLSPRETEILDQLCQGLANKEIADRLSISIETVRVHLRNIYDKLHVRSRTEAAMKYRQTREPATWLQ